jgi:hypothetical protein
MEARQLARCRMLQTRGSQDGSPSCRLPRAVPDTADRTGCRFLNDAWPSKSRILLKEETRYCKHSSRTLDTIQLPYVYPQAWMVIDSHAEIRGASCVPEMTYRAPSLSPLPPLAQCISRLSLSPPRPLALSPPRPIALWIPRPLTPSPPRTASHSHLIVSWPHRTLALLGLSPSGPLAASHS